MVSRHMGASSGLGPEIHPWFRSLARCSGGSRRSCHRLPRKPLPRGGARRTRDARAALDTALAERLARSCIEGWIWWSRTGQSRPRVLRAGRLSRAPRDRAASGAPREGCGNGSLHAASQTRSALRQQGALGTVSRDAGSLAGDPAGLRGRDSGDERVKVGPGASGGVHPRAVAAARPQDAGTANREGRHAASKGITVALDDLNAEAKGPLRTVFGPARACELGRRVSFRSLPKRGSARAVAASATSGPCEPTLPHGRSRETLATQVVTGAQGSTTHVQVSLPENQGLPMH